MRTTRTNAYRPNRLRALRPAVLATAVVSAIALSACTTSAATTPSPPPTTNVGAPSAVPTVRPSGAVALPASPTSAVASPPSAPAQAAKPPAKVTCQRTLPSYPLLRPGDKGPAVAALQCLLNDAKVGPVVVDGSYGAQTRAAVLKFARATEGAVDTSGRIEPSRWVQIIGSTLSGKRLKRGSHGADVTTLQRALRAQGCTIAVDGSFGAQTEAVLKRFQTADAEPVDGVLNDGTRFMLSMGGLTTFHCS